MLHNLYLFWLEYVVDVYFRNVADEMVILSGSDHTPPAQLRAVTNRNPLKTGEVLKEAWQLLQPFAISRSTWQLRKPNKFERKKAPQPTQCFPWFHQIQLFAVINHQLLKCRELPHGRGERSQLWTIEDE